MAFGRRKYLLSFLLLMGALLSLIVGLLQQYASFSPAGIVAAEVREETEKEFFHPQPIETMLGKVSTYDINFLWFDKAAVATFLVEREGEGYRATLEGETKGFVGFLTSYRKHIYISHMKPDPQTGHLMTTLFERYVVIGTREEKSITYFDYKTRTMSWESVSEKWKKKKGCEPIPEGVEYEDVISAFLNFRSGAYGPIERGRKLTINTIPSEGQSIIGVSIISRIKALADKYLFGNDYDENLIYIKVKVPKEIFKSATGEVSMWIDEDIIPIRGVVKDYIGFGDMTGILRKENHDESK